MYMYIYIYTYIYIHIYINYLASNIPTLPGSLMESVNLGIPGSLTVVCGVGHSRESHGSLLGLGTLNRESHGSLWGWALQGVSR